VKKIHNLCIQTINMIGFDEMCKKYERWWLEDGIVSVEEIQYHFRTYLYSVSDILQFFKNYLLWPFERYRNRLGFNIAEETFIIQLYHTYSTALKNYKSRKEQLLSEHRNTIFSYSMERDTLKSDISKENRLKIQELERITTLAENKRNESMTSLKANWREIKRLIRNNWINYKSGTPQLNINTSFASSTEILPVQQQQQSQVTVVVQTQPTVQLPAPSAPYY